MPKALTMLTLAYIFRVTIWYLALAIAAARCRTRRRRRRGAPLRVDRVDTLQIPDSPRGRCDAGDPTYIRISGTNFGSEPLAEPRDLSPVGLAGERGKMGQLGNASQKVTVS